MERLRNVVLFGLLVVLFGGAFPAIKAGLAFVPPLLLAAARYYLSAVLLLGYAVVTTDYWQPRTVDDWTGVLAGGTLLIGGTGLSFAGMQFTTSGVAAIIFSLIPILTVLVGWVALPNERLSRRSAVGVIVGFVGVAIVVQPQPGASAVSTFGNALVFLATVSVTVGTVLVRRAHPPMSVVALTGWAMLVGATIQLAFSAALGESLSTVRVTAVAVLAVLYLAVFAGGIGFVIYFELLEEVGVLEVNLVTYLNPVVAVILGWMLLNEPVLPTAIVGFVVVFAGFVLLKNKELAAEFARLRGAGR